MRRGAAMAFLALATCAPTPLPGRGSKAFLRDVTAIVALPTFTDFAARADALAAATTALAGDPDAGTLSAAQSAWADAHAAWKEAEVLDFGPVAERSLDALVDRWPSDAAKVEAILAGGAPIDAALVDDTGADARGLPALELLLFAPEALADLTTAADAARRRDLVAALGQDVALRAHEIAEVWSELPDGFALDLLEAGTGSERYETAKSAVDVLVNQIVFTAELVLDGKLGRPAGKKNGGTPQPTLVEARASGRSLAAIAANLRGIEAVWSCARGERHGVGLADLVGARSAAARESAQADLDAARDAVEAVPEPLDRAVIDDPAAVEAAYQAVRAVRERMATEVVALLGATLTFNDNDGD